LVLSQSSIFGQNPKIWYREFNDLQIPKCSKKQLCDRTMDCPHPRAVEPPETGGVIALPEVDGFHHHYERQGERQAA
jgi:hypothetical protein